MKLRRRYSMAFLTLIYAVGTIGLFTTYYTAYHRQAFQVRVREAQDEELMELVFSKQEYESIVWMEEETEFEWQGKLYDVSRISATKDGFIILCENDSFEEALLSFVKSTKSKEGQGIKKGSPQPQFFGVELVTSPEVEGLDERENFPSLQTFYHSICQVISLPPPEASHI